MPKITKSIRIGTRGSALALTQTNWVKGELERRAPGRRVETVVIKTSGDRFLSSPILAIGGKGIFVKEIEDALLEGKIDLAVHSMKDLPTEIAEGLAVTVITAREDPRDVLVTAKGGSLKDLPAGARVGTGSLRRQAQILKYRPDLQVCPIRGNVDTRLKKLERGEVDALVMAAAGLKRLGQEGRIGEYLPPEVCLSAVAQGALGIETRAGSAVEKEIAFLHDPATAAEVWAERAFLKGLGGGCEVPVGARGVAKGKSLKLTGLVADRLGKKAIRDEISGAVGEAEKLGEELARRMLARGADHLLREGEKPLSGRRIMITRPREQAGSITRALEGLGAAVIELPTIELVPPQDYGPLDGAVRNLKRYDWIVFTSVNGVKAFFERLASLGGKPEDLKGARLAAIGPETARSLTSRGLEVDLVPAEFRAEGILEGFKPKEVKGKRFLLPRAAVAREVLPQTLREWGAEVDVVEAYRTLAAKVSTGVFNDLLSKKKVDMVAFTSSSTVKHFLDLLPGALGKELLRGVAVACIGPITRQTAEEGGMKVSVVAEEYTVAGLIEAIVKYFSTGPLNKPR